MHLIFLLNSKKCAIKVYQLFFAISTKVHKINLCPCSLYIDLRLLSFG